MTTEKIVTAAECKARSAEKIYLRNLILEALVEVELKLLEDLKLLPQRRGD